MFSEEVDLCNKFLALISLCVKGRRYPVEALSLFCLCSLKFRNFMIVLCMITQLDQSMFRGYITQ